MKNNDRIPLALAALAVGCLGPSPAFADLIAIGQVSLTGQGLGAVNTLTTFQNTGAEVGAVGLLPISGTIEVTGGAVAFGIPGFPFPGGTTHETAGNAGSNLYSAASIGVAPNTPITMSNVVLLFNGVEGGNAADLIITLENLALNLFSTSGALLGSYTMAGPFQASALPGVGNAGYGFQLDATQAMAANSVLAAYPSLIIGAAARASGANAGPETISISTLTGSTSVPESGSTAAWLGLGAMCLAVMRRISR